MIGGGAWCFLRCPRSIPARNAHFASVTRALEAHGRRFPPSGRTSGALVCHSAAQRRKFNSGAPFMHRGQRAHRDLGLNHPMSDLIQIVTTALASATERSGSHLVCRPGCTQCCHGVFAISQQDAARLRDGLASLTQSDPARSQRIQPESPPPSLASRPASPATRHRHPRRRPRRLPADESGWDDYANDEPCPVLDPPPNLRPLLSAPHPLPTFGPPARTLDGNLATASSATPPPRRTKSPPASSTRNPALEADSDQSFNAAHHVHGETLIAYALRVAQPAPQRS